MELRCPAGRDREGAVMGQREELLCPTKKKTKEVFSDRSHSYWKRRLRETSPLLHLAWLPSSLPLPRMNDNLLAEV